MKFVTHRLQKSPHRDSRLACIRALRAGVTMFATVFAMTVAIPLSNDAIAESTSASTSSGSKSDAPTRNFYEVLEDLLGDFEYDLKNGGVQGLKDLSIRNLATSENVPNSFKSHLELLLTERILKHTKTRVVQCLPCRSRRAVLNGDQMVVTSAESNGPELARIARTSAITNFMDAAFSFQSNGMVLSLHIAEAETGAVVWSRSYNSETSKAAAFRRGVDFTQTDEARSASEYSPTIQYRAIIYYAYEKNVSAYDGCLGAGFRMMERYDNRRKEVGFELDFFREATSLVGATAESAGTADLYSGLNLTLLFMHSWNIIGDEENYNRVRGNVFGGIGGTYASGFLGGLARAGYEWRLAKHWGVSANVGYRPKGTAFVGSTEAGSVSGVEAGLGISALF